jgi:hypothetical protein
METPPIWAKFNESSQRSEGVIAKCSAFARAEASKAFRDKQTIFGTPVLPLVEMSNWGWPVAVDVG